jgi:S-DNA-T family DNA segregation ATPase FtsK/SpoIIIE
MSKRQATSNPVPRSTPDLRWLRKREVWGVALGLLSLVSALALVAVVRGALGLALTGFWRGLLGWGAYPVVALGLAAAAWLLAHERVVARVRVGASQVLGVELFLLACLALSHLPHPGFEGYLLAEEGGGGGYVGWALADLLARAVGQLPGGVLLAVIAVAGAALTFDVSWDLLVTLVEPVLVGLEGRLASSTAAPAPPTPAATAPPRIVPPPAVRPRQAERLAAPGRRRRARSGRLPSLDLLVPPAQLPADDAETRYQAQVIEETLAHFGVPATVADVQRGPAVTQFGVEPGFIERQGPGGAIIRRKVRVGRIAALSSDLALALAAPSLRIEAPVPGRALVGIEVPNREPTMVNLRSVVESEAYQRIRSPLRVALGQGVAGRPAAADLASMPHLLIAGATGSGKSVCINALIACLLLENPPEALNLVLIDPKRVELSSFGGVPHLVAPVVIDLEQTVAALRWLCREMDARYQLFARHRVRHIEGYNAALGRRRGARLPYLAVFVDELADLMMLAPDEVERSLCRLAQMGRATGVHLVVATQRPSVDVLTGLIKANFPARIAFAVSSQVDSRVILDAAGAEQLLGRGDMLFMSPEANHLLRLQGCFVSDVELAAIVGFWREAVDAEEAPGAPWAGLLDESEEDALYDQALELVRRHGQASASLLQRRLRIGYSRAARLIEQLEAQGIIGPDPGGGRPRPVFAEPGPDETTGEEER